jgi:uncharacterized protein YidB (DUF937 family)
MSLLDAMRALVGEETADGAGKLALGAIELLQGADHGGLAGVLAKFREQGFEDAVNSWIGTGANLPIGGEDIQRVLGSEKLRDLAARAGVPPDFASGELASILPRIVDRLTPDGRLPDSALAQQALSMLRGVLGR